MAFNDALSVNMAKLKTVSETIWFLTRILKSPRACVRVTEAFKGYTGTAAEFHDFVTCLIYDEFVYEDGGAYYVSDIGLDYLEKLCSVKQVA